MADSERFTTIGQIFYYEILCIKICGGVFFTELPLILSIVYRISTIIVGKTMSYRYLVSHRHLMKVFSRATRENISLSLSGFYIASNLGLIFNFYSNIKYRRLTRVILNKRLDRSYLNGYLGHYVEENKRQARLTSSSNSTDGSSASGTLMIGQSKTVRNKSYSRITFARYLLVAYLAITALVANMRDYSYERFKKRDHRRPNLDPDRQLRLQSTVVSFLLGLDRLASRNITSPAESDSFSTSADQLNSSQMYKLIHRIPRLSGSILLDLIRSALEIAQSSSEAIIALMVVAVMTEMLKYCLIHDGLDRRQPEGERLHGKPRPKSRGHSSLLTTELLNQVRDVLVTLRLTTSFNYLFLLLVDLTRLMALFSIFTEVVSMGSALAIIFNTMDYLRVVFHMTLCRIGYDWLHTEVQKLRKLVEEKDMLAGSETIDYDVRKSDVRRNESNIDYSQRITIHRLAEDISSIWPTDWYTPDMKNHLRYNIFVITTVATLHQLVGGFSRVTDFESGGRV